MHFPLGRLRLQLQRNKVAVTSRAGTSMGLATARRFTARGARVFIMGRANPNWMWLAPHSGSKGRNRIERCVNKLKCCRRLATRHDGRAIRYLAFVHLAAPMLWPH
jgi:NAD(P)-dependent dehydrogenase (short-subunit alcohol dehydrogenase family)